MNIIRFKECNVIYAEDQEEYLPLPALKLDDGEVISCWGLTILERLKVLFTGRLWLSVLTFNKSLQPLRIMTDNPIELKQH